MRSIIKHVGLITLLYTSLVHSNDKPIRMLDHCPDGKGCPKLTHSFKEPYGENFEVTESDFFPVEFRWRKKFESDVFEKFDHNLLGLIRVRVSGLDCESANYAVVELEKEDLLKEENMKKLVVSPKIVNLIDLYEINFVYFIRVTKSSKHHDCEWFLVDETDQWEMTCGS